MIIIKLRYFHCFIFHLYSLQSMFVFHHRSFLLSLTKKKKKNNKSYADYWLLVYNIIILGMTVKLIYRNLFLFYVLYIHISSDLTRCIFFIVKPFCVGQVYAYIPYGIGVVWGSLSRSCLRSIALCTHTQYIHEQGQNFGGRFRDDYRKIRNVDVDRYNIKTSTSVTAAYVHDAENNIVHNDGDGTRFPAAVL